MFVFYHTQAFPLKDLCGDIKQASKAKESFPIKFLAKGNSFLQFPENPILRTKKSKQIL